MQQWVLYKFGGFALKFFCWKNCVHFENDHAKVIPVARNSSKPSFESFLSRRHFRNPSWSPKHLNLSANRMRRRCRRRGNHRQFRQTSVNLKMSLQREREDATVSNVAPFRKCCHPPCGFSVHKTYTQHLCDPEIDIRHILVMPQQCPAAFIFQSQVRILSTPSSQYAICKLIHSIHWIVKWVGP